MQASRPVDGNVALLAIQSRRTLHAASGTDAAKLEEAIEDGAVVANIVFTLLSHVGIHVVWRNFLEEVDIIIGVELCHFASRGRFCALRLSVCCITLRLGCHDSRKSPSSGKGCTA